MSEWLFAPCVQRILGVRHQHQQKQRKNGKKKHASVITVFHPTKATERKERKMVSSDSHRQPCCSSSPLGSSQTPPKQKGRRRTFVRMTIACPSRFAVGRINNFQPRSIYKLFSSAYNYLKPSFHLALWSSVGRGSGLRP